MRNDSNARWWVSAAITALPVAFAVALVAAFPPGQPAPVKATPAATAVARTR